MLPFRVSLDPGESPFRQTVFAATRAIVSGELGEGDPFPSVRDLSQALRINPNTAHKVVAELIRQGLLEARPGIGTVVAAGRPPTPEEREALLSNEVEVLVVEARRLRLTRDQLHEAVDTHWNDLSGACDDPA